MRADHTIYLPLDNCSVHDVTIEPAFEEHVHGLKVVSIPHIWLKALSTRLRLATGSGTSSGS